MSFEGKQRDVSDAELELALKNFKSSVHSWSEQEFARTRPVNLAMKVGFWSRMRTPVLAGAMGLAMAVTAVTVPVKIHHDNVVAAQRAAAEARQKQLEAENAAKLATESITDEELLSHVDTDIAQATPYALEPLANMMEDSAKK